jgi:hypothetical protein
MIAEVTTGDPTKLFCLTCAKKIVTPHSFPKYYALTRYLKFRGAFTTVVKLSLARIDSMIRTNLPITAYRDKKWWANSRGKTHATAWLNAGWTTQDVNLEKGYVVFRKVASLSRKKPRRRRSRVKKPFTPAPVRFRKTRMPSKTKLSKLHARIQNLERQKASSPQYRGRFKPKSRYEKKLYKPDEKPQ